MENVYGKTEQERNSIVQIPDGFAENSGNTLYSWLGSIWRSVHKGDGMIRGLHAARGIRRAQLYLDLLESLRLQDRNRAPVFHRELWHPIVVRLSKRDTSQENMISVGIEGKIGPQPEGSAYGQGTVFSLGRLANFKDYVTYPVDDVISGGALTIVDNIVNPTVFMERGKDYEIRNNSIIFHRSNDPLGKGSSFDRYDVPGLVGEDGEKVSDMEAVLWASDVLIDRGYISDHISYVLGADAPSSDVVKRILNAAWSSVTSGLTHELVKTIMAAMLNIPVIQSEKETVLEIYVEKDDDGHDVARIVRTDAGSYRISMKAKIRKCVRPGAVLSRGDLLDESVRIYPYLNGVEVDEESDGSSSPVEYTGWDFDSSELPEGFAVDNSSIHFAGSEWTLTALSQNGELFFFYSELGYDSEEALVVRFYSDDMPGHITARRDIIEKKPRFSVMVRDGTGFSENIDHDIPSVVVPSSMIRARTEYGVYAMWGLEEVKKDKNGRLYFDIGGTKDDVSAFWEDVWSRAKETGTDMKSIIGSEGEKISPAEFFLRNLVGANTLFVVVDRSQVDDASMMRNPMFFDMLSSVVPSAIRLFLVEHRDVGDGDAMDMADAAEDKSVAAALPEAVDLAEPSDEMVSMRFFRPPPEHVRGAREEE